MPFLEQEKKQFTLSGIKWLDPGQTGVYGIFNDTEWIYIGQTEDLRERLLQHIQGFSTQSNCILKRKPKYYVAQVVSASQLDILEQGLIAEYKPYCN